MLLLFSLYFTAFSTLSFMSISFDEKLSFLANLLFSLQIEYFFFCFLCVFTNCSIKSVVVSKYFFNHIVVVSQVNSWIKLLPLFSLLT